MSDALDAFDHDAWRTALGTAVSYALVLVVLTAVLFGVPYLAFTAL
ncbi:MULTISPECIES: hypothetical protein [Halobacterium]|nr:MULTISPECIES: hypothetical protein [Halobacterium]MDL0123081.1 hypothetical protein [Halobacterium salinarum]MDL0127529.1 hypothetical protein [Halobacterium salinarum]MDL0132777.1 hypothetical protein [Halobacterium salinarum]QRY25184.1 hypothetical protein JRZ79_01915 [Halobacterium sp. BOL4-2]